MLVVLLVASLAAAVLYRDNPLTGAAQRYAASVATASVGVYVTLRTLNAVLSTAQEVEVGGSVIVSGTVQPLKMLEPVDDTVERVAAVVFAVMLVTGVLSVALGPVAAAGWGLVALAAGLALLAPRRADREGPGRGPVRAARRLAVYGGFFALALPLAFLLSSLVADRLTAEVWDSHRAVIAEITREVAPDGSVAAEEEGFFASLSAAWDGIDDYRLLAAALYDRADDLVASFVAILSVFLFKIVVLPGLLAGGLFVAARGLARGR